MTLGIQREEKADAIQLELLIQVELSKALIKRMYEKICTSRSRKATMKELNT